MLLQFDFLIWIWSIVGIPFLFFGIPSIVLLLASVEFENVIVARYLSTGFEDLKPTRPQQKSTRFREWCLRTYDMNNNRYDFLVNFSRVMSIVLLLCFGYFILWILGVVFFSFFSYRQLVRMRKKPNIKERSRMILDFEDKLQNESNNFSRP